MFRALQFAISVALLSLSTVALAATEDGLCVLAGAWGVGTGFIVKNRLFTAAHVLDPADQTTQIYCLQNGKAVNISGAVIWKKHIHPQYNDSDELKEVEAYPTTREQNEVNHIMARVPYDIAYLDLNRHLASRFILDPSRSILETGYLLEKISASSHFYYGRYSGRTQGHNPVPLIDVVSLKGDIHATDYEFNKVTKEFQTVERLSYEKAKVIVDPDTHLMPGHSGGPLYYLNRTGQLVVIGIAAAIFRESSQGQRPGMFTSTKSIVTWLNGTNKELFLKDCQLELRATAESTK